jgi:hypothetical protein
MVCTGRWFKVGWKCGYVITIFVLKNKKGGLYSGMGPKTPSQKRKFGGIAYVKADPCYHLVRAPAPTNVF